MSDEEVEDLREQVLELEKRTEDAERRLRAERAKCGESEAQIDDLRRTLREKTLEIEQANKQRDDAVRKFRNAEDTISRLEDDCAHWKGEVQPLQDTIETLERKLRTVQNQSGGNETVIEDLRDTIKRLEGEIDQLKSNSHQKVREAQKHEHEAQLQREAAEDERAKCADVELKLDNAEAQIRSLKQLNNTLDEKISDFEDKVKRAEQRAHHAQHQLEDVQRQLQMYRLDSEDVSDMNVMQSQELQQAKERVLQEEQKNMAVQAKLKEAENRVRFLHRKLKELQANKTDDNAEERQRLTIESLKTQLAKAEENTASLQDQVEDLRDQVVRTEHELKQHQAKSDHERTTQYAQESRDSDLAMEVNEVSKRAESYRLQIQGKQAEIQKLEEIIADLKDDLHQTKEKCDRFENANLELRNKNRETQSRLDILEASSDASEALAALQNRNDDLLSRLNSQELRANQAEEKVHALSSDLGQVRAEADTYQSQVEDLKRKLQMTREQGQRADDTGQYKLQLLTETEDKLMRAEGETNSLKAQLRDANDKIHNLEESLESANSRRGTGGRDESLRIRLQAAQQKVIELEDKVTHLTDAVRDSEDHNHSLENNILELKNKLSVSQARLQDLEESNDASTALHNEMDRNDKLLSELSSMRLRTIQAEDRLVLLEEQKIESDNRREDAEKRAENLHHRINGLRQDLSKEQDLVKDREQKIQDLKDEVQSLRNELSSKITTTSRRGNR